MTFCTWVKLRSEPPISPCIYPISSPIVRQDRGILRKDTSSWVYFGVYSSCISVQVKWRKWHWCAWNSHRRSTKKQNIPSMSIVDGAVQSYWHSETRLLKMFYLAMELLQYVPYRLGNALGFSEQHWKASPWIHQVMQTQALDATCREQQQQFWQKRPWEQTLGWLLRARQDMKGVTAQHGLAVLWANC